MQDKCGTPYYMAPEVIKHSYNESCDIWSCGVILYILLSGKPPFSGYNEAEIMKNILAGQYSLEGEHWKRVTKEAKDLIHRMLDYNPKTRITAQQALEHEWFSVMSQVQQVEIDTEVLKKQLYNLKNFRAESKLQQVITSTSLPSVRWYTFFHLSLSLSHSRARLLSLSLSLSGFALQTAFKL